jgi:hypothetical protein
MTGKDVLEIQLTGSFNMLHERLATVSDQEWIDREIPETSLVGFTFWHAPAPSIGASIARFRVCPRSPIGPNGAAYARPS